jgi:predicted dehydrogenase
MKRVNWGILGAANIAVGRTIPAMLAAPSATPVALASRSRVRGEAAVSALGIARFYDRYDDLLADPDIDAVYVPAANADHFEWCVASLEAGKHVLCEKPLVLTSTDVMRLIAVRDRAGRHIEEAFSYRHHPQWADIARIIDDGEIGAPRAVHAAMAKQFRDPADIRNNPALGGGALYDLGSYAISAIGQVFRRAPLSVSATIHHAPDTGVDRLTTAMLDYGDAHATFSVGIQSGPAAWGTHQQFSVLGDSGWLSADFPFAHARPTSCRLSVGDDQTVGTFPSTTLTYPPANQYELQVERFSRAVLSEAPVAWPIEDALLTLRIIEAVLAAARSGAKVELG